MVQKSSNWVGVSIAVLASSLLAESCFVLNPGTNLIASASELNSRPAKANAGEISQTSYPIVGADAWLDPFGFDKLIFNSLVLIEKANNEKHLAVLSLDILNPPSTVIYAPKPGRKFQLVTQWSRNELRAYAYEQSEDKYTPPTEPQSPEDKKPGSFKPNSSREVTVTKINPSREVNRGLYPMITVRERRCDPSGCRTSVNIPSPVLEIEPPDIPQVCDQIQFSGEAPRDRNRDLAPIPSVVDPSCQNMDRATEPLGFKFKTVYQVAILIGTQQFNLEGKGGVFPISSAIAKALRETTLPVKVTTPNKWEATVSQNAVTTFKTFYQEPGVSRNQK